LNIIIKAIPHKEQAYETVGDYAMLPNGVLDVVVSELGDARMEFLVGIHEAIEAGLMHFAGIPLQSSTDFDVLYEAARPDAEGWHDSTAVAAFLAIAGEDAPLPTVDSEPGDHPAAPYRKQHTLATAAERMLAAELGVDWHAYTEACEHAGSKA